MKTLVIGSDGFVGGPFCSYLETRGVDVVRFDVKRSAAEDARTARLPADDITQAYVLAWDVGGAKYLYREASQLHQLHWNLAILENVLGQLGERDVPFVFVSSQLAQEVDTVYGVTKRLGEVWTHLLPKGICVRLWNVYGPYEESTDRSHVIADFVHQALDNGEIRMLTTGEERRQFVHIDDVCRALRLAMVRGERTVCDISSFEWTRVLDAALIIGELTGARVVPGERKGNTPATPNRGPVPGAAVERSFRDGLERMVGEFRKRKGLPA